MILRVVWSSSAIRDTAQLLARTLAGLPKFASHSRFKMRVLFMQNPWRKLESLAAHVREVRVLRNSSKMHSLRPLEIDAQIASGSVFNGQVGRFVAHSPFTR